MNLIRYEPWHAVRRARRDLDDLFGDHFFAPLFASGARSRWVPAVDVHEEDAAFVLTADLPGVAPADIDISAENGQLIVRGKRDAVTGNEGEGYRRTERLSGEFERRFQLPEAADAEAISANSTNGVLTITIPKKAQLQPRRIEVKVA